MTETETPAGLFGREPEERGAFPEQAPGRPEDDFSRPVPEREARSGFFAPGHGEAGEDYFTPAHGETGGDAPAPGKGEAGRDHSLGGLDLAEAFAPGDDDDVPALDERQRDFAPESDDDFFPENGDNAFASEDGDAAFASANNGESLAGQSGDGEDEAFASESDDDGFASGQGDNGAAAVTEVPGAAEAGAFAPSAESAPVSAPAANAGALYAQPGEADDSATGAKRARYLGIRLRKAGQVFFFPDDQLSVRVGSKVIVEFEQGSAFGEVDNILYSAGDPAGQPAPGRILGPATARDIALHAENHILAGEATAFCTTCIRQRSLDMKLVDVEVLHDRSKIIFYFTAPARIDFRELVKDLVRNYRTRIELRQIGVRHETQMVGGIGNCGMVCCCHQYLRKFAPVTIKMAKEQNLFLNPAKLSGMCGRLLCCLSFEQSNYDEFNRRCPKLGKRYTTSEGTFRIVRANMFARTIVACSDAGEEKEFTLDEWAEIAPRRAEGPAPEAPQGAAQQSRRAPADGGRKPRSRSRDERRHGGRTGERDAAGSPFPADAATEDDAFAAGWDRDDPLDFAGQEGERRRDHERRDDRPRRDDQRPRHGDRPRRGDSSQHDDRPRPDSGPAASPVPPDDAPDAS